MLKFIHSTAVKFNQLLKGHGIAFITGVFLVLLISVSVYLAYTANQKEKDPGDDRDVLNEHIDVENHLAEEVPVKPQKDPADVFSIASLIEQSNWSEPEEPEEPEVEITGVVYLTFDDGPSRSVTPGILELLAEEEIKATFFVIYRIEVEDIYQQIADEGHELANHSHDHNYNRLYSRGVDAFKEDILKAHNFVLDNFGYEMKVFRFPGGSMSWNRDGIAERREILDELGYIDFDWHVDSRDAAPSGVDTSAETLTRNVLDNINGTEIDGIEHVIILMHDYRWRQSTLEALPAIIFALREQGYIFDMLKNYPSDT